ncbi:amino acid ABC transporter permease [Micropruina sonneratiae]|uniref:amino acid ABC transporter permease n=1 Tax=Micropruina sonneratiae TaxID=2986940 RepID=UPI0022271316|nr:amino acid ABC transporter permease [Micropruina sp. KQZ13P-5]MCW3156552.1 amino acid ABC transporter permease [Micropruina sp. KQZ13P-5]
MTTTTADAPARKRLSPRKRAQRARIIQYAGLGLIVLLGVLFVDGRQMVNVFFRPDVIAKTIAPELGRALLNTVIYTIGAFIFGLILGTVLALMRLSSVAVNRWLASIYIEFFRGVPAIIVFMAFSLLPLAIPGLRLPLDPYGAVWMALGLVAAAYMAETIRAGIQAVPKGQLEAARSLGMPAGMATQKIVLPQAFRIVTPPLTNELILLTKDSSLVYVLGLTSEAYELTKYGRELATTYANLTPLVIAGLSYLIITLPLTFLVRRLEAQATKAR